MITIIMSIGFSVDYSAHITYGYVISDEKSSVDRICNALGALGWPLTQGAISTILAVILARYPYIISHPLTYPSGLRSRRYSSLYDCYFFQNSLPSYHNRTITWSCFLTNYFINLCKTKWSLTVFLYLFSHFLILTD